MRPEVVGVLIIVLVIVAGLAFWFYQQRKSRELRERFGPEYDRKVSELGDRRRAEAELSRRADRVERLEIRPLPPQERTRFAESWGSLQSLFVDDPVRAISEANRLVTEVMRVRGYPVTDFEQRAADISVDHPHVVSNYRAAYEVARRSERGEATTEDLRQGMVHYRALFEDLLEVAPAPEREVHDERARRRAA